MAKTRTVAGAGTIATAALVVLFGNQPFTEWVDRRALDTPDTAWEFFLRTLTWPRWSFGTSEMSSAAMRRLVFEDLRAILLIAFVALLLAWVSKAVVGGAGGFLLGWSAVIFASALAAFLTSFIVSNP